MESLEAVVEEVDGKHHIRIGEGDNQILIPISEDQPKKVKKAFNRLIARVREGPFEIELKEVGQDLFSEVAEEYLKQLNREIAEVRDDMRDYDLLDDDT